MKAKNADPTKSANPIKTPPGRKPPASRAIADSAADSATLNTPVTTRGSAAKAKQPKNIESTPSPIIGSHSKPEQLEGAEGKPSTETTVFTPDEKVAPRTRKVVRKVVKRVVKKTPGSVKPAAVADVLIADAPKTLVAVDDKVQECSEKVEDAKGVKDFDSVKKEDFAAENLGGFTEKEQGATEGEEPVLDSVAEKMKNDRTIIEFHEAGSESEKKQQSTVEISGESANKEQASVKVVMQPHEVAKTATRSVDNGVVEKLEEFSRESVSDKEEPTKKIVHVEGTENNETSREDAQAEHNEYGGDEGYGDRVDFGDQGEDDFIEEDPEELPEEAEALEEERRELTAAAKERKNKKEYEIFVGGLDRDATEEDLKNVFEKIGEVVEVRLHKNLSTNKNKGYAFVKFANKEHAKRALSEMKNPVICEKRCGTAPSEDNDTLFLGNICNTWTKEAIRQKLKEYGVGGLENITLVADVQHEGKSRGFAFLEFSCHADAMLAYKRLQKPDVVFGHPERTAKVAFAEPIREPDPEVMAQVKTIFLDGLPPHWDEDRVRECLKGYGEIVRIVLARNMSTAKRKDFGFADFSTHEAAVACIEGINNKELHDGNLKIRVRARLSNPMRKTQAVKGGMCGGFRIGHTGGGNFSRFGRGFAHGGHGRHHFNRANFPHGRGFYQRDHGQTSRIGPNDHEFNNWYNIYPGRQTIGRGGRRPPLRGPYHPAGREMMADGPSRHDNNRTWHDPFRRGHGDPISSRRQPFPPQEAYGRSFVDRRFGDPYFSDDGSHGMKRPFYMTDHDPDYSEPSRLRPRFGYPDPSASFRGTRYNDIYEAGNDPYAHDYYGPDYGSYPPYYGSDRPYGGGYYY